MTSVNKRQQQHQLPPCPHSERCDCDKITPVPERQHSSPRMFGYRSIIGGLSCLVIGRHLISMAMGVGGLENVTRNDVLLFDQAESDRLTKDFIGFRYQAGNETCRDDLASCDVIYDSECAHVCEREIFHRIESCFVNNYPFLKRAMNASIEHPNATACFLYDGEGYLRDGVLDFFKDKWPKNLIPIPYTVENRRYKNNCLTVATKRLDRSVCFNVKPQVQVMSAFDGCNDTCWPWDKQQILRDIQKDMSKSYGGFDKRKQDTVLLIARPKNPKRKDARAFADLPALERLLRPHFNLKIYNGTSETFSPETAAIFSSAKVVIGYHGAGFSNLIFSHSNNSTVAIELFARNCTYKEYFNKRIAEWGIQWKQLVVGTHTNPPSATLPKCRWVQSVQYDNADLGIILKAVLNAFENMADRIKTLPIR